MSTDGTDDGDRRGVVVLGDPVAGEAETFGPLGQLDRIGDGGAGGGAVGDGADVEHGEQHRIDNRAGRPAIPDRGVTPVRRPGVG